jgi:hypothetical protein
MKKYLFAFAVLFFSQAQGAYLFFQKQGDKFLPIHDIAVFQDVNDIVNTYAWPMAQNLFKVSTDPSSPSYSDLQELISSEPGAEEKFLGKKVQEKHPHVDLVWIPSILQEMYAVSNTSEDQIGKFAKYSHLAKDIVPLTFEINNNMVKDPLFKYILATEPSKFPNVSQAEKALSWHYDSVLEELLRRLEKGRFKDIFQNYEPRSPKFQILATAIRLDLLAYFQNKCILWRATQPVAISQEVPATPYALDAPFYETKGLLTSQKYGQGFSTSYAAYLFSGFYFDPGACTFKIFNTTIPNKLLYAVLFDKKEYLKLYRYVLHLSSTTPVLGLFDRGEWFHPRTYGKSLGGSPPPYPAEAKENLPQAPAFEEKVLESLAQKQITETREQSVPRIKKLIHASEFLRDHPHLNFEDFIQQASHKFDLTKLQLQLVFGIQDYMSDDSFEFKGDPAHLASDVTHRFTKALAESGSISDTDLQKKIIQMKDNTIDNGYDARSANWVFSRLLADCAYVIWVNNAPVLYDFTVLAKPVRHAPDIRPTTGFAGALIQGQQLLSELLFKRVFMLAVHSDIIAKNFHLKEAPGEVASKVRAEIAKHNHRA